MEAITDKVFLQNFWPVSTFEKVYGAKNGLVSYASLTKSSEAGNPDKTAIIMVRMFIEDSQRLATKGQKYIIGLRFYSFGDMATLDIISLDRDNHRDITHDHAKNMGWTIIEESLLENKFQETYTIPIGFAGGFIIKAASGLAFSGASGDFTGILFAWHANEIANYVNGICGFSEKMESSIFFKQILSFLTKEKLKKDFYEKFLEYALDLSSPQGLISQQIGAIVNMKAVDRALEENRGLIEVLVEEITDSRGIAKTFMLQAIANQIQRKKT